MGVRGDPPSNTPYEHITNALGTVFSILLIAGINIIVSGHLLGFVFDLDEKGDGHFKLPVPPVMNFGVYGNRVIAGFAAFALSFLCVIVFFIDFSIEVFITKLDATLNPLVAAQSLAALISVAVCVFLALIRYLFLNVTIITYESEREKRPSDEEIIDDLINKNVRRK